MTILTVEKLSKAYKKKLAVTDFSMQMQEGEIVGILGPNGAGKTTCFYMLLGLVRPDGGKIILSGKDITNLPIHNRGQAGLGYLPQEASIFRKLSTKENIQAVLELNPLLSAQEIAAKVETLLQEFRIKAFENALGISLSGGERRRTEIARAVANSPKFLLLDEPFAGVDPISIVDIKNILRRLSSAGIGILITDHNVRDTLDICNRAYIVHQGKVVASGSPQEIFHNPRVREVYLGDHYN